MDGKAFGDGLGKAIVDMGCFMFVLGGGVAIGLYFLIRWIWDHLSVSWS